MSIDTRLPRYQRLRDELAGQIAEHRWAPGQAIPTEHELASTYGLAIGTVRKAIDRLVADGLLERFQGRGTFVRRPNFDGSLLRFFRLHDERHDRSARASRILMREVTEAPSEVSATLRIERSARVIHMSRLRLVGDAPILAEEIWLPYKPFAAFAMLDTSEIGDLLYPVYETYCHQVIASARETLTIEIVDMMHARLLRIDPGTPVVVVERIAYGYDRRPLEWRRSRGPASEFAYQVEIR
ncbi:GntR family transcriptional regulator [Trinickia symbiotica]|uniref:GntR family transcriptional regulator n=1 Tax=Trinickia symbiotica TaxID=863227 RepID=A0A2T3XQ27_9BURK|nr:GntR family transcriptional regulator [Trinickia symbiotica]PTB18630.1 GntR family transcriptional regulator [Trinickia symbiotica]